MTFTFPASRLTMAVERVAMTSLSIPISTGDPLPGTVKLYGRHVILCTGQASWPSHIDEDGGFAQVLAQAVEAAKDRLALTVKITACDAASNGPGMDLLVFPDCVRYLGLSAADIPILVADHLTGNAPSPRLRHRPLSGRYVFVCTHGQRDYRCGECGPLLFTTLYSHLAAAGLAEAVHVYRSSHVGGHAYAGNVLIYPEGDWYGYVTAADVPRLVDRHLVAGEIVWDLWRGRMGLTPEQAVQMTADR